MVIDCFTFFNELDLLEVRLQELYDNIDKFVIVEAAVTQSLLDKPFYFEENKDRYKKYLDKIVHIKIEKNECVNNDGNLWKMENFQRNYITKGVNSLGLNLHDIILISDLDEIPRKQSIQALKLVFSQEESQSPTLCSLELDFFAYYLNLKASNRSWVGTAACNFGTFKQYTPQSIRASKDYYPRLTNAGWHFSWLGGYEKVYEKSLSCIEPFDKSKLPSLEEFRQHFEDFKFSGNKFFIHLEQLDKKETPFSRIEIDEYFPQSILDNLNKYSDYII
jgi:beta-1,4-mannosyl-glycoprotein beta-1,4-N-acetylglucosaminyltransferase